MKLTFIPYPLQPPVDTEVLIDLTGMIANCKHLSSIIPSGSVMDFANFLLAYSPPFLDLMEIIYPLYESKNVTVVYNGNSWEQVYFVDAFSYFLYERYDLVSNIANDIGDYPYLQDTEFSVKGLYNLDLDKDRATKMTHGLVPYVPLPIQNFNVNTKGLISFGKPVME